jgi:two-component system nitrate/nitrite response regulator NarL
MDAQSRFSKELPGRRPGAMITVVILADIRLYREGLAEVLGKQADVRVVGTGAGDRAGVTALLEADPDVALVDMAMIGSAAVVRSLAQAVPRVRILALAVPETDRHVLACAEAGIAGYVPREGTLDDLIATLRGVARGEAVYSPRMVAVVLQRLAAVTTGQPAAVSNRLTARELEIVDLIDCGLTNREIATRLCIELATVKNHVHNLLEKLQIGSRGEAAAVVRSSRGLRPRALEGLDHPV